MTTAEPAPSTPLTYASAGVDTEAGDRAVELMRTSVSASHGPEVLGGFGGFAGMYDASVLREFTRPVLITSTDGVGTKIAIARAMDKHDTIGQDLVAMVVDDLVVTGGRPLFMTDYIACGRVVPERIADIVSGIATACAATGTALVGGETAEHPGVMEPDDYDVAGAATGVVEHAEILGAHRVREGDVLIGLASSGLHSNGFSLLRGAIQRSGWRLDRDVPELGTTLGEAVLEPTALYTRACLNLIADGGVHALSHVTGGGLAANLARVLPQGLVGVVERGSWQPPAIFEVIRTMNGADHAIAQNDLEATFNMGVGMVAVVSPEAADSLIAACEITAWRLGGVVAPVAAPVQGRVQGAKGVDGGAAVLVGTHA